MVCISAVWDSAKSASALLKTALRRHQRCRRRQREVGIGISDSTNADLALSLTALNFTWFLSLLKRCILEKKHVFGTCIVLKFFTYFWRYIFTQRCLWQCRCKWFLACLREVETEFANNLECESGVHMGLIYEKTRGWKSHATVPLR